MERHPLETVTQFTMRRIRAEIIEECARVAERRALRYSSPGGYQRADEAHEIAKDIRGLVGTPPTRD